MSASTLQLLPPIDVLEVNRGFYRKHADEFCHNTAEFDMTSFYRPFVSRLRANADVLDAGCGSGRDSVAFQKLGFRVEAIDSSPEMVNIARSKGVVARGLSFQQMKFRAEFDGIWACASLLHVPRRELGDVLFRLERALRPSGAIYISVKEGDGEWIAPDGRFFSYSSVEDLSELLRMQRTLRVVEFWRSEDMFSAASRMWLNFVAVKQPLQSARPERTSSVH